ncbi:polyketide synthase dehydratase domain-containing protein, partial [Streptomyces sioyaensis]|uniref:polyketide synthase dehydratase domain-containing protein n=1 Tax=Streptomyces sioyaensis TaxID=67364 RepID=UPI0033F66968
MPARGGSGVVGAGLRGVGHGVLGACVGLADGGGWVFTGRVSVGELGWLSDHGVGGVVLVPGVALAEWVLAAGERVGCSVVEEVTFQAPLVVSGRGVRVQVRVEPRESDAGADGVRRCEVGVYAQADGGAGGEGVVGDSGGDGWVLHASGVVGVQEGAEPVWSWAREWPPAGRALEPSWYEELAGLGYEYGPAFRGLRAVWRGEGEWFGEVELPSGVEAEGFVLHPALWDACLHTLVGELVGGGRVQLPFSVSGVRVWAAGARRLRVRVRVLGEGAFAVQLADLGGQPVAELERLVMRPVDTGRLGSQRRLAGLHTLTWQSLPASSAGAGADAVAGTGPGVWWVLDPVGTGVGVADAVAGSVGARVERVADVAALREKLADPEEIVPGLVAVAVHDEGGAEEVPWRARRVTGVVLGLVQQWLAAKDADPRLAGIRLAVLTRGAIATRPGEDVTDLAAAAVWGLLRSAQSEHPGSFLLLDHDLHAHTTDAGPVPDTGLTAVLTRDDEPQLALREHTLTVPRLT